MPALLSFKLRLLVVLCSACLQEAANREYFVRSEEVIWDAAPSGIDRMSGKAFEVHEDADVFMVNRPHQGQIGRSYWKCLYEEYTDGAFKLKKSKPPWAGMLGPTLRCEVGDRLVISFQNACSKPMTMHPHGVKYNKASEGAPYNDGRDGRGDYVYPGETYTYMWTCDEHAGPGPNDPSSVVWLYHSHNPSRVDSNSGLIGPIVVTRRGDADEDGKPLDVDKEFVVYMSVVDENQNYLLDRNIDDFIVAKGRSLTAEERTALIADKHFEEGNLMHGINGRLYGNLEGFEMQAGERVRWYVFSLGTEADLHSAHFKGHSVVYRGQRTTMLQLMPGMSSVADMTPWQEGEWGLYCHTNDHIIGGMLTSYRVAAPSVAVEATGTTRTYYIQAEEVEWDFGPSNNTLYNTSFDLDEDAKVFFQNDPAKGRIGGKYMKCIYVGYTDSTFATRTTRSTHWKHLGMLGPIIRGEVGDTIEVFYSNRCSKPTSINVASVLKPKGQDGWMYGDALGDGLSASGVVAPGAAHTYEWQVVDGPGPLDLSSIGFVYTSHHDMSTDTNSGLVGLLIITGYGQADASGKPLDVMHEMVQFLSVTDESSSYLLDANFQKYVLDKGGGQTNAEYQVLKEDDDFLESNLMHGINGRLFGTLEPPQLVAGDKTRVYALAVGTEVDMHSFRLSGHSFLVRGERRAQLNLMPNEVVEADFIPTAGTWSAFCQTNDHLVGGMIAHVNVAPNPRKDPMVVKRGPVGKVRKFFIRAEEVMWDYGVTGSDQTGQYYYMHGHAKSVAWEDGDGQVFMANDPKHGLIGRKYLKCLFRGYDSSFTVAEDRSPGSEWEHLGVLGPIIHAEVGDTVEIELRNNCSIAVSMHPQIAGITKENEGFQYTNADGTFEERSGNSVKPGARHVYRWLINDGPGPRDGSSIGTMYYSMANGMAMDTYSGLKGPLVITRKGFADARGRPRDVATELVIMFEVTNEGDSYLLQRNVDRFVLGKGGKESDDDEAFEESNLMHGINGQLYANLRGLRAKAETKVRWYVLSLGTEVDLHSVHWHAHTVLYGGHSLDVVMNMPATGITADMYVDNVGTWLMHCHVNDHIEGGMTAVYEVTENPDRGEAQISTCQQMYGRSADSRRDSFNFSQAYFDGHLFDRMLSPYFRLAYTVNYAEGYFDAIMAARATGWLGIGFYSTEEAKAHPMLKTDMIVGRVKQGSVIIDDTYAMGLETPKLDSKLGGSDQLTKKEGWEENGNTYISFRRSFKSQDLDDYDFNFRNDMENVRIVYAYSSINSDNLVYHGPTRGYSTMPWNMNCSSNLFFDLAAATCVSCDRGHYRIASDSRYSFTKCERCPQGTMADTLGSERTSEIGCKPVGVAHATTLFPGAASYEDIVCEKGFYHPCPGASCLTSSYSKAEVEAQAASFCQACPPGMACPGGLRDYDGTVETLVREHQKPVVPYGFYSPPGEFSVYACFTDARLCPGGDVNVCVRGREGLQCATCEAGMTRDYDSSDGSCRPCDSTDTIPFSLVIVCLVIMVGVVYHVISSQDFTSQSNAMLIITISGAQMVTALQMLGAIAAMSIHWASPLRELLDVMALFTFRIDVFRIDCLSDLSPFGILSFKVLFAMSLPLCVCVMHVLHVILLHRARFRQRCLVLYSALGTFLMAFFISIAVTAFSPLHCSQPHPNGKSTLSSFPTVVCWEAEIHKGMIALGLTAALVPLGMLSFAMWVVLQYPGRMALGDVTFFRSVAFLLCRFRTECYWYVIVFMIRNLSMSLTAIIPDAMLQAITMFLILLSSLITIVHFKPWRIWLGNVLEGCILTSILLTITMAKLFIKEVDSEAVSLMCLVAIIAAFLSIPLVLGYGFYKKLTVMRGRRKFSHFFCHHKAGAGALARLLKLTMEGMRGVRKAFLDSDDLTDLGKLFDYVRFQSDVVVLLCSAETLSRPWCIGELVTAKTAKVDVVRLFLPGYEEPSERFIQIYDRIVRVSSLAEYGIGLQRIQDMLHWLAARPKIIFQNAMTTKTIHDLARVLAAGEYADETLIPFEPDYPGGRRTAIVVDNSCHESVSAAIILSKLLHSHFVHVPEHLPFVLGPNLALPPATNVVLLVCSKNVFSQPQVLGSLEVAARSQMRLVPILTDDSRHLPDAAFFAAHAKLLDKLSYDPEEIAQLIKGVFKEIAVVFQPHSTAAILETKAAEVANRITSRERYVVGRESSMRVGRESSMKVGRESSMRPTVPSGLAAAADACSSMAVDMYALQADEKVMELQF
eukprot:TRINITY_DN27395_c0_g1_i1.p1 TRINITY_DN27395_c0_g1~~TRINITY_DN27395_c0_g1_i1.p1  ORF type:complete len:2248 (-),score=342.65 TRINITY_DN27395_c0_g1_i1:98-6841(-)